MCENIKEWKLYSFNVKLENYLIININIKALNIKYKLISFIKIRLQLDNVDNINNFNTYLSL